MFGPVEQRISIFSVIVVFTGQQLLSTVGMSVLASFLSSALSSEAWGAVAGLAFAFGAGYAIQLSRPRISGIGCWVGVLPAAGWVWAFHDALVDQYRPATAAQALVSMFRNNGYDEGVALAISITAGSAIAYSAGAYAAVVRGRRTSRP